MEVKSVTWSVSPEECRLLVGVVQARLKKMEASFKQRLHGCYSPTAVESAEYDSLIDIHNKLIKFL